MRADQIATFEKQRAAAATRLQRMLDTPEEDRPTEPKALKAWLRDLESERQVLRQLEVLLKPPAPSGGKARAERLANAEESGTDVLVAIIPKSASTEIRVAVRSWSGGKLLDLRVYDRGSGGEPRATRKGLQVDAKRLHALLEALTNAQRHV